MQRVAESKTSYNYYLQYIRPKIFIFQKGIVQDKEFKDLNYFFPNTLKILKEGYKQKS